MFFSRRFRVEPVFFVARSSGLAYLQMPKVACTSFQIAIAILNRPEIREQITNDPPLIHLRKELSDTVTGDDSSIKSLFRFTFVRNPLARFLSFYYDKIFAPRLGYVPLNVAKGGFTMGMSLSETLDLVEKTPPHKIDRHIAPQHWYVYDGDTPRVQFVGKIENVEEDLARIFAATGQRLTLGHYNKSTVEAALPTMSDDEERRIRSFYSEDYERFGYE